MNHSEVLNFLKKLAYFPLLINEDPGLMLINKFAKTKTLIFLVTDDPWGQSVLVSVKNKESYNKLLRYLKGMEPFINLENLDVTKENKELEFTVTINKDLVSFKVKPLPNVNKDLSRKFNSLGIGSNFTPPIH